MLKERREAPEQEQQTLIQGEADDADEADLEEGGARFTVDEEPLDEPRHELKVARE